MANRYKAHSQPVKVKKNGRPKYVHVYVTSTKNAKFRPRKKGVTPCTEKRKQQRRNSVLKKNYGITLADYNKMLGSQSGRCAICGTCDPKGRGAFHVDHCHKTTKVRGLLCSSCNTALGHFKDDPQTLERAVKYLRAAIVTSQEQAMEMLK